MHDNDGCNITRVILHPSISCMLMYSAIPTIFVRYLSIHSLPSPIMNRLRAIPDRASIVEFTFKQNLNERLVQQQIPMGRPEHVSEGGRPTSPRKRQRMGADYDYPIQMADDAFVYLDHDLPQHSGSVKISFNLLHFNLLSSHSDDAGLYSGMDPSPRPIQEILDLEALPDNLTCVHCGINQSV